MPQIDAAMGEALMDYLNRIAEDYRLHWQGRDQEPHIADMIDDFTTSLTFETGRKYVKVVDGRSNGRSVHSFVVLSDGGGFLRGDILKPASWDAPALNFRRGNVFEDQQGTKWISWAGF
jgi:hypothetical protein